MRSIWERWFGRGNSPAQTANDPSDILDDVRQQVRRDIAAGFDDPVAILDSAISVFEGEVDRSLLEDYARQCLDEELAAHSAEQRDWPQTTDCDRLDAAFSALEAKGVISRQHFTCCGTCGSHEIQDEIDAARPAGGPARGYAFYHWQDTEAAVDGYGIYLNFGACDDEEAAALAIGRDIVAELERQGLETDWDGSWEKRIGVSLDWKRRRPAA